MTRGLSRRQIGVTEAMVEAYGPTIWEMSHNIQVRIGDPVRELDWEQIEAQREGAGLADVQIAERIGLTREQVTHIRVLLEHRKFHRHHYHRLYELGGGKRYRPERIRMVEDHHTLSEHAMALRGALDFDPRDTGRYIRTGKWGTATPSSLLLAIATEDPRRMAVASKSNPTSYAGLMDRARAIAVDLARQGVRRGEVFATQIDTPGDFLAAYCAASFAGAVMCPLPAKLSASALRRRIESVGACLLVRDGAAPPKPLGKGSSAIKIGIDRLDEDAADALFDPAVASDPLAILFSGSKDKEGTARASVHNAHTLLAGLHETAEAWGIGARDRICVAASRPVLFLLGANLALNAGAALCWLDDDPTIVLTDHPAKGWPKSLIEAAGAARLVAGLGGEPFPAAIVKRQASSLCRGWSIAEAPLVLSPDPGAAASARLETDGAPPPAGQARLVDRKGEILLGAGEGRLEIKGPSLAASYWKDAKANRARFTGDRWFKTGRRAERDVDGNITVLGEAKKKSRGK